MKFSKDLGQIFLKNKKYLERIASLLEIEGEDVLEIGAGRGELTQYLVSRAKSLICIEIDSRFIQILKEKFSSYSSVEIICGDILKLDFKNLGKKLVVVGNIPFQISSPLLFRLIEYRQFIKKAFLTFQKEFAQKLVASPKSKDYSFLSCYTQYYAQVKILLTIPRKNFSPPPKVDSCLVKIDFFDNLPYKVKDEKFLFQLIKKAFSQRRKKLINALDKYKSDLIFLLDKLKIDKNIRVDALSLEKYCQIANFLLYKNNNSTP